MKTVLDLDWKEELLVLLGSYSRHGVLLAQFPHTEESTTILQTQATYRLCVHFNHGWPEFEFPFP